MVEPIAHNQHRRLIIKGYTEHNEVVSVSLMPDAGVQ